MRILDPVWLEGVREKRRTLKDITRYITPDEIYRLIMEGDPWPYRTRKQFYLVRDRALISLLYSTCGRVNEVLRLTKDQFNMEFEDPDFIEIQDFQISKRKKVTIQRKGIPRVNVGLPLVGSFKKFTDLILDYLEIKEGKLFRFGTRRAWQIVKHMTGLWNHYFRCQRLSYDVNLHKSSLIVAKIRGIENPGTITHYYKTEWEDHKEKLKI